MIDYNHIDAAEQRIRPYIRHTPLDYSPFLSQHTNARVYLKWESLQHMGSFKPRISFNKLLALGPTQCRNGVIASTAGGHGTGLAFAGQTLGIPVTIFAPKRADPLKVEMMRRHGAQIQFFNSVEEARGAAREMSEANNMPFISAYNDPDIIAGSGTIGVEIAKDLPTVDVLITGIGGGGLISGSTIALRHTRPAMQAWGVQPSTNAVLAKWWDAGKPVDVATSPSIAEGLGAHVEHDTITFPLLQQLVQKMILVSDPEIRQAMRILLEEHQMVVEPSGAAPVAALLKSGPFSGETIVIIITGRNISAEQYLKMIA